MGRGLVFLQRYTSGQRAQENMLNIMRRQGNANQNQWGTSRMLLIKVTGNNKCWQGRGETGGSYVAGGDGKRCGHFGKQSGSSSVKPRNPMCPSNSTASSLPKRDESTSAQTERTPAAALLTISGRWTRPRGLSVGGQINNTQSIHTAE